MRPQSCVTRWQRWVRQWPPGVVYSPDRGTAHIDRLHQQRQHQAAPFLLAHSAAVMLIANAAQHQSRHRVGSSEAGLFRHRTPDDQPLLVRSVAPAIDKLCELPVSPQGEDVPMRHILGSRPVMTEETHRATAFEIFFDLVFVFALTRVIEFMGHPPTPLTLAQGLILLMLFWNSWTNYTWLGNQARADLGAISAGTTVAMAALFVAALVIPDAWRHGAVTVDAPLTLALAYIALTAVHLTLYFYAATGDRRLRTTLSVYAGATALAWIPLVLGASLGGTAQTLLWAGALLINLSGGLLASKVSGWPMRSPSHFTERHGLVLMIALGESLISVGAGAGPAVTRAPVLIAALLAFITTLCLWRLYFKSSAPAAGEALGRAPTERRNRIAANAYSFAHFPLIAGVIYIAMGIEQVLANLSHNQPGHFAGTPLDWTSTVALYGGAVLYLLGRVMFLRYTVGSTPPALLVALGAAALLLPAARILPALATLGLLATFLAALAFRERPGRGEQDPTADEATHA
jgi:low temperature requirement protein LtrA